MAISRNAFQSLVESVQDTVTQQNLIEWPITIGGRTAYNARDLAQILNSMQNNNPSGSTPSLSTGVSAGGMRSGSGPISSRRTGAARKTSIAEDNRPYIPSNLSGAALSQYLHNLSQGGLNLGVETGASGYRASRHTSTRRGGNKRPTTTGGGGTTINTGGGIGGMGGGVSSVGLGEDFDILDEILAEGLELYGEDGLAEILADFAETGEMSQELADLLEGSDQLQEVSLKKKIAAYAERSNREFESDGDDPSDFTKSGESKADRTLKNIMKVHGKKAASHAQRAANAEIFGRKYLKNR